MDRSRYKGMTSFLDLLWILLAGLGAMFIIAFLLIQPPTKDADVIKKAEYMIVLEWDNQSKDDVDLWVQDPNGNIVSFINKSNGLMNLEKDDLGQRNDFVFNEYGKRTIVFLNREVVTIRGILAGEYQIMVHIYSRYPFGQREEAWYKVEVIKVNPYAIKIIKEGQYNVHGQELSVARFTLDKDGEFVSWNNHPSDINKAQRSYTDDSQRILSDYLAGRGVGAVDI